jgi:23S rRNA (guanosine2251-2'-O)-methyltransferase
MFIILHNIRSAYNVGAIFRTADATNVEKIYLTGYTPTPLDRFGRTQSEIKKTSLGASSTVPWESGEFSTVVEALQQAGVTVVAVEQTETAQPLHEFASPAQVAFVFGNEITGVEETELALVDAIVELPMLGTKESLNVSVTAGVVMYHEIFKAS